jgi:cyclopropane fatty-acyl-phospholipid synthase-like methyltransferase
MSAFRERYPEVPGACEAADASSFFDRRYDGIVAWGLMFLLASAAERCLIKNVARTLTPGGRFLFTAPSQSCTRAIGEPSR